MAPPEYYDRAGQPITPFDYWRLNLSDFERYCRVGLDEVGDYTVSTTWTGLDTGPGPPHKAPLIFETVVVDPRRTVFMRFRTATEDEARAMHQQLVTHFRNLGDAHG